MSVTVIPYNDPTSEIFGAWRTIEEIKNKSKQIAMDQALAQQHLQSAQTIDQINQAKLQMDQQQAAEFTTPDAIARRKTALDTGLQQEQAGLESTNLQNDRMRNENPLHLIQQEQATRLAKISADSAQQNYESLMEMMPAKKELEKMTIQSEKYKLISQNQVDSHTADLLSQINSIQTKNTLEQLPQVMKLQQEQINNALSEMGQKPIIDRLKTFSSAAAQLGVPGAKAAVQGLPGYENFQNVPDESMKQGNEKDRELHMLISLAKTGDSDAQTVLGARLAKAAGAAPENPMSKMIDPKTGKQLFPSVPDELTEAAKRVAAKFAQKATIDSSGEYSISDNSVPAQREKILSPTQGTVPIQTTPTQTLKGGEAVNSPTPVTPSQTSPTVESGTQDLSMSPAQKSNAAYDFAIDRFKKYKEDLGYYNDDLSSPSASARVRGQKGKTKDDVFVGNYDKYQAMDYKKQSEISTEISDSNATAKQQQMASNLMKEMLNSDHPERVLQAFGAVFGSSALTATQRQLLNKVIEKNKIIKE